MIIASIFLAIMFALAAYLAWTIWEAYGEARNERLDRARRRRVIHEAEYQIHTKASEAFRNMMRVAREQTDGCRGHR
jgi:hypothetical protein